MKNVYYIKITEDLETTPLTRESCKSPWKVTVLIQFLLWAIFFKNLGKYFNHFKIAIKSLLIYFIMKVFCKKGVVKKLAKFTEKHLINLSL